MTNSSIPSTSGAASCANAVPEGVSSMGLLTLSNNLAPISASSFLICVDTVG